MRAGLLIFACSFAFAQTAFEVASVKQSPPVSPGERVYFGPPRGGPGTPDPGQITWTYALMKAILMTAYDAKAYQIAGPDWTSGERYDIVVRVPAGATRDQVGLMWQNLLAERFGLVVHHESRDFRVEELVVAKGGPKLKETAQDLTEPQAGGPPQMKDGALVSPGVVSTIYPGKAHTVARAQPISQLTSMLSNQLGRPVIDKTGLTGKYDFTIDFAPAGLGDNSGEPLPDLAGAVQEQLGLKLVAGRAKIDVIVIDRLEKTPTSN